MPVSRVILSHAARNVGRAITPGSACTLAYAASVSPHALSRWMNDRRTPSEREVRAVVAHDIVRDAHQIIWGHGVNRRDDVVNLLDLTTQELLPTDPG